MLEILHAFDSRTLQSVAMRNACRWLAFAAALSATLVFPAHGQVRALVLDNVRIIDGTGAAPIENGRIVMQGDRIAAVGPAATVPAPADAERVDLAGRTVIPGLIDLHFHIENDPRLALRQLSHGVTAFRDPGQWNEKFVELRRMIAADGLPGPRIFTTGPHIDGEHPAYPADSVVARDREEARRHAETNVAAGRVGAEDLLPAAVREREGGDRRLQARHGSPARRISRCSTPRELIAAGLHGVEHITSFGVEPAAAPAGAKPTARPSCATTTRGATAATGCSPRRSRRAGGHGALRRAARSGSPWVDPDARRLRAARRPPPPKATSAGWLPVMVVRIPRR